MRDSLKEHVDAYEKDFELYPFDANDWDKIANRLDPPKRKYRGWLLGVAASLAVIFISTVLVFTNSDNTPISEVAEMEGFYQEAINQKISLVKNQLDDDRILEDLNAMDDAFADLKSDLEDNVDNEEVIMAMMENYRLKLQILEEILSKLEKEERDASL
jgi:anion-transporting  ArsA/GET3 family ATPase